MLTMFGSVLANAQNQGICGKVIWVEGNQMPGPGKKSTANPGVERELHVYEAVTSHQAGQANGFYTDIKTKLIAKVKSKADGTFKIKLSPGVYSVFTKESEGLFANTFDQNGVINAVVVDKGKFTKTDIIINYKAAY